jgi:hypothetical protein
LTSNTYREAPHYAVSSILLLLSPS